MSDRARASSPTDSDCFERFTTSSVHELGSFVVDFDEVVDFARRYDPQPIHTDPDAARAGPFGGIIASGWHTIALTMRLCVSRYLSELSAIASPGIDELRWYAPVRPGDTIAVRLTILEARRSQSKPGQGVLRSLIEARNQDGVRVMSMIAVNLVHCRDA